MKRICFGFSNLASLILVLVPGSRPDNTTIINNGTTLLTSLLQCGNTQCSVDLDEVCSPQFTCVCPEKKDRRNESEKCSDYTNLTFPLLLARQQPTGRLLYNYSYSDPISPTHASLVSRFESGMINVLQHCNFFQKVLRLSVDRVLRPVDVNRTWIDTGLWVEFTLRLNSSTTLDDVDVYKELLRVITTDFQYSLGSIDLRVDRYQPPLQCFQNNCPKDGLCIPLEDRFKCQCQVGCRDLDPTKPGRVCSCPCISPDSHSCPQYSDCIPSDNSDGHICKCKTGFLDVSSNLTSGNGPQCVFDSCLGMQSECERKNATCIRDGHGSKCQCLDGYVDVRRSLKAGGAVCLKPQDIDECALQMHSCIPPATCVKTVPTGYQCQCPDSSSAAPAALCSLQSRMACALCNQHGTCAPSLDNSTTICECDDGYSGSDCSVQLRSARLAQVWKIGDVEIEWSWVSFGIGCGLGVLACLLLFTMVKVIQRQCRKKPTVRPSPVDDEVFNFHEVTRNVYGVGGIGPTKESKLPGGPLRNTSRTSLSEASSPPSQQYQIEGPCPYAVSEVSVSTFKRNGVHA